MQNEFPPELKESVATEDKLVTEETRRGLLDFTLEKLISRKLLVVILATIFLCTKLVNENTWLIIIVVYLSFQGVVDSIVRFKGGSLGITKPMDNIASRLGL
jgi:hypothetical protein